MRARRLLTAVALAVAALVPGAALVACGSSEDEAAPAPATATRPAATPIRIGTKDFTEEYILGELYAQALEAKGFAVTLKKDIGSSEIIHQALDSGAIDMYPDYVGILLSEVAEMTRPRSPAAAYAAAKRYEERNGMTLLAQTPFSDSNAFAVKPAFARRHRVRSIADLKRLSPKPRIGAGKEFQSRFEGLVGLRRVYGMRKPRFSVLEFADRYKALDSGRIDVLVAFTTERQLEDGRYVLLDDPRGLFASNHVAPVISQSVLRERGPRLRALLDAVSAKLTTSAMRRMNGAVDVDGRDPRLVAREFLQAQGLL